MRPNRPTIMKPWRQRCLRVVLAAMMMTANGAAQTAPTVTWLILIDDLHFDFHDSGRVRALVQTVLNELPMDGDTVAMRSCAGTGVRVGPTANRALLYAQLKRLTGFGLTASDLRVDAAQGGRETRERGVAAQSCVRELIASAGGDVVVGRRQGMLYISNGYASGTPPDFGAGRSPTVFALDPRVLEGASDLHSLIWPDHWTAARQSLRLMAERSSGFVLEENHSVAHALKRIGTIMRQ